jgi:hypothetical protein
MNQRAISLMDVLAPPGNNWLKELSRRKTDLPPGVHIVRFSDNDDDLTEDDRGQGAKTGARKAIAA